MMTAPSMEDNLYTFCSSIYPVGQIEMATIWMLLHLCNLVALGATSHFRGAIIQWQPVDAENFDGRVRSISYNVTVIHASKDDKVVQSEMLFDYLCLYLQIRITHRISWRNSYGRNVAGCSQRSIESQTLLGTRSGTLDCRSGCSGTVGSMTYYCTDFSRTEDWATGERTYVYNIGTEPYFEAS